MPYGPCQPVEFGHDEDVTFPAKLNRLGEGIPLGNGTGLFLPDLLAADAFEFFDLGSGPIDLVWRA